MRIISIDKINSAEFRNYGMLISKPVGKPLADETEFAYWGKIAVQYVGKQVSFGHLVCNRRVPVLSRMERHVSTPEVMVSLSGNSILCLASVDGVPGSRENEIIGFKIKEGDAVILPDGAWHWVPYPVDADKSTFLIMFAEGTEENDLEVIELDSGIPIEIFPHSTHFQYNNQI